MYMKKDMCKKLIGSIKESVKIFDWKSFHKAFILSFFFSVGIGITLAGIHLRGNTLEGLLFYARVPMSDGSTQSVNRCLAFCVPAAIRLFIILLIASYIIILNKNAVIRKINKVPVKQIYFIYRHFVLASIAFVISSAMFFGSQIDAFSYFKDYMQKTEVYNEEYTDPEKQEYIFPEKKKNLIYIFLESMESSFASVAEGGLMPDNYIPYLTELAKENISFSDTDLLGGAHSVAGTTWTAAAMVTQTSGIPVTIPISKSNFGKDNTFLPGAYSIGEILESAGYNQELMVGSIASYAKREAYFVEHGNYRIFDYYTAEERMLIPKDYFRWWGFEDQKLFEYAKYEITNLYNEGKPFNFTMLTVDTHFTDGYKCEQCEANYDNQYANVIRCSDKQIHEFIEWIKQQPFYEDTVIVLAGDHITMDHNYFNRIDEDIMQRGRRIYNCFINTGLNPDYRTEKNRDFSTLDMFPTTLAALGVKWGSASLGLGVNLFSDMPTLCELKGVDGLSNELASSSDFYSNYIIDYQITEPDTDNTLGAEADIRYAEKYREAEQKRQQEELEKRLLELQAQSDASEVPANIE